jgi:hypothetical protein
MKRPWFESKNICEGALVWRIKCYKTWQYVGELNGRFHVSYLHTEDLASVLKGSYVVRCKRLGHFSQLYNEWSKPEKKPFLSAGVCVWCVCVCVCVRVLILASEYTAYNRIKHLFCLQCNLPWRKILPNFITVTWKPSFFLFELIKYNLKNSHELNPYNRQQVLQL